MTLINVSLRSITRFIGRHEHNRRLFLFPLKIKEMFQGEILILHHFRLLTRARANILRFKIYSRRLLEDMYL